MTTECKLVGNTLTFTTTFTDPATGLLADPTSVELTMITPAGVQQAPITAVKLSLGVWRGLFVPAVGGEWTWRMKGVGAVEGSDEGVVVVRASAFV